MVNYNIGDKIVNRYQVLSELGRGSYGVVYKVYDNYLDAELALKFLIIDQGTSSTIKKMTENMFKNEYEVGLRVKSPFAIRSYDYFEINKIPCFTMEFASGGSFFNRTHDFVNNWDVFNKFAFYFYCGLGDIHRSGVIHRDIKAENILLDNDTHPKITDFGISHILKGEPVDKFLGKKSKEVIGTEPYLAPEQRNEDTSSRQIEPITDIFAAGVMMYFLITKGRYFPFGAFHKDEYGYSEYVIRTKHNGWEDILNHRSDTPDYWQHIIEGSLQSDTKERIKSADYIRDILQQQLTNGKVVSSNLINSFEWDEVGLKIVVGQNIGAVYPLYKWMTLLNNGLITLGRLDQTSERKNSIELEDVSAVISRRQAVIEYDRSSKKWHLRNGQFDDVNGQKIWREPPTSTMLNGKDVDRYGAEIVVGDEIILGKKYLLTIVNVKK